ncbi:MAG: hypothetical protein JJE25_12605 [Bacteroidia bacterium]|nr:hypothetical protein [Bacteroidia bacterium]
MVEDTDNIQERFEITEYPTAYRSEVIDIVRSYAEAQDILQKYYKGWIRIQGNDKTNFPKIVISNLKYMKSEEKRIREAYCSPETNPDLLK